jgi:predicted HTH transcriptional regulator
VLAVGEGAHARRDQHSSGRYLWGAGVERDDHEDHRPGTTEFKYRLPIEDKEKERLTALANTNGGTIIFGVDPDEVTIVGLEDTDIPKSRDRLVNIINTGLTERPHLDGPVEQMLDGKRLMVLIVNANESVPYGVIFKQQRGEHPKYYVRRGAKNFPATPEDIRASVRRSTPSRASRRYRGGDSEQEPLAGYFL